MVPICVKDYSKRMKRYEEMRKCGRLHGNMTRKMQKKHFERHVLIGVVAMGAPVHNV